MRVYVIPRQAPRLNGFGAFNGEAPESYCNRVYASCPDLLQRCLKPAACVFGVCSQKPEPYTLIGKKLRGLPMSGQCPGTPAAAPAPQQQPYNPPPDQQPYSPQPTGAVGPITAGGPFVPPASGGPMDQLLANKPLLIGGVAVLGFFAWRMTQRSGRGAVNGYRKRKSTRN